MSELTQQLFSNTTEKPTIVIQTLAITAGIFYWRTKLQHDLLLENHNDFKYILINRAFNVNDEALLRDAKIVHVHKFPAVDDGLQPIHVLQWIKDNDGKLILDIDDHWLLHDQHPAYSPEQNKNSLQETKSLFGIAAMVTTPSEYLKKEIGKINPELPVTIIKNCYNPDLLQFHQKESNRAKPTIGFIGGSSHKYDLELLDGVISKLSTTHKNRFKTLLAGWDTRGSFIDLKINEEFVKELGAGWTQDVFNYIRKNNGDIRNCTLIPKHIRDKYVQSVILMNKRDIKVEESVYYEYERILTDNWEINDESERRTLIDNFQDRSDIETDNYHRIWTKDVDKYMYAYDNVDIVLAPLTDTFFNKSKSNLKMVEAASRKLPIICTDIEPYNSVGTHMYDCILIKNDLVKKNTVKAWVKAIKYLIDNPEKAKQMGENLFNTINEKNNLKKTVVSRNSMYLELNSK